MSAKVTKRTPSGVVELRGTVEAMADAMEIIGAHEELADALRVAYRFLSDNHSDADMPDILPKVRAAAMLARVQS